jgi:uncharacterized membrane protein YedE/YeeE
MKPLKYVLAGLLFGIVMYKSEAASWYRIFEMFHFRSFHMFGIIGVAVFMGLTGFLLIRRFGLKNMYGEPIVIAPKEKGWKRYIFGGTLFGLGWALSGACPGPMFVNFGTGLLSMGVVILGAVLGTFLYGFWKDKLPH